jgi:hypothetical protein
MSRMTFTSPWQRFQKNGEVQASSAYPRYELDRSWMDPRAIQVFILPELELRPLCAQIRRQSLYRLCYRSSGCNGTHTRFQNDLFSAIDVNKGEIQG